MFEKIISKQFKEPSGLLGRVAARVMNTGNSIVYDEIIEVIGNPENMTILEIGYGNGETIRRLSEKCHNCKIYGIDISDTMLQAAVNRNRKDIEKGKVKLEKAGIDNIPFENETFDLIFTLNTLYFWPDPDKALREIERVLKKGGKFINSFQTRESLEKISFTKYNFIRYSIEEIVELYSPHNLKLTNKKDIRTNRFHCICTTHERY